MKISKSILEEKEACEDGLAWFGERYGDEEVEILEVVERLRVEKDTEGYMDWLFDDFKLSGLCERWCENGELRFRENYKNGERHGLCEWWHENGELWIRENYKGGELHGLRECWYESGELWYRENYKDGRLSGLCEEWRENGKLLSRINYKNGEIIDENNN